MHWNGVFLLSPFGHKCLNCRLCSSHIVIIIIYSLTFSLISKLLLSYQLPLLKSTGHFHPVFSVFAVMAGVFQVPRVLLWLCCCRFAFYLSVRSSQQQREVNTVFSAQNGHGFFSVLNIHTVYLQETKGKRCVSLLNINMHNIQK